MDVIEMVMSKIGKYGLPELQTIDTFLVQSVELTSMKQYSHPFSH